MAAYTNVYNSIHHNRCTSCASNLVLPITDAAILLVVSVLVCLRVILLGT